MQLSLFGWPPVASHLTCLVVGLACAHLTRSEAAPKTTLASGQVLAAFPKGAGGLAPGHAFHVVRSTAGASCRLSVTPWQLVEKAPRPLVRLPVGDASALPEAARELKGEKARLEPAELAKSLPVCSAKPRITYGS